MKHFLTLLLLVLLLAISTESQGQTVTLNQADLDYAPGETVYITGTKFRPGEVVTLAISHIEPDLPLIYHEHDLFSATANANGSFNASWYVKEEEWNTTLQLIAKGNQGSLASIVFTIKEGKLTIGINDVGNENVCAGSLSVLIHSFTLTASSNANMVEDLTISFYHGVTYLANEILNFKLYYTTTNIFNADNLLSTINNPPDNGKKDFPAFDFNTEDGATYYFWITMDVSSSVTDGTEIRIFRTTTSHIKNTSGTKIDGGPSGTYPHILRGLPPIIQQPIAPAQVCAGNGIRTISVIAKGSGLTYQWRKNGVNLSNAAPYSSVTTPTLTITNPDASENKAVFDVVVTGPCGLSVISSPAVALTVNTSPTINSQPTIQSITYGTNAIFSATASSTGPLTYQWQENNGSGFANIMNGGIYSGATSATLAIARPRVSMSNYQYRCVVSGQCSQPSTSNAATLTVNPRPITITPTAGLYKVYGEADPTFTYTASEALQAGDSFSGALGRALGNNVGAYAYTLNSLSAGSNYTLSLSGTNTFAITTRPITITADAKTKTYGNADPALTAQATNVVASDTPSGSLVRAAGENVGSYPITKSTYTYGSNYNETFVEANFVIGQRPITITADAMTKTYGDDDPALTAQATNVVGSDTPSGSLVRAEGENVGLYLISNASYTYGSNYAETFVEANLVINQRPITITADAKTKTYGETDPALTSRATNVVGSDTPSGSLVRAEGENVGSYLVSKASYTFGSNYAETFVEANLVINQRPITITADAKSKTYGDTDPAFTYQITNGTLAFSDAFTGSLTRDAGETVGDYAITQGTVTLNTNYTLSYIPANLAISARPVTITSDAKSKVYGDTDPALTAQAINVVGSDTPSGSLARAAGENVGSYAISKSTYTYGSNYAETFVETNLVINQRPITITADAKTKTYGNADPALTAQATNVVGSDMPSGTMSRAEGENVGSYAISKSTYTYGSNYAETFVEANLVIGQRAITITADAKTKYIGQDDPALTYQTTSGSLANGDAFTGSLSRTTGECAGTYTFEQGTLKLNENYVLGYNPANFTIIGVSIDASQSSTPVPTGSTATLSATVTPAVAGIAVTFNLHNGVNNVGSSIPVRTNGDGIATATVSSLPVEVYKVTASIGSCAASTAYLAVYDPNGGFVTGGGWITSPAGAYLPDESLTGKANFGFVSKYRKGSNVPEGNTEFQFQTGNLNFSSSSYNAGSLVIAGSQAIYKGVGTINGAGSYNFMVSAVDGQVTGDGGADKFRIKIWNAAGTIYDNNIGKEENATASTDLGGGSIVIHSNVNTKKVGQITPEAPVATFEPTLKAYPNPFSERLNIEFSYETDTKARLEIYSVTGAKLQTLYDGPVAGGQLYTFEYLPRLASSQVVFYHLTLDGKTHVGKMLYRER